MQDDYEDQVPKKPNIHMIERSPLLQKAENMAKMLQEDQLRIDKLISEKRANEISIEEIDENDAAYIQMNVIPGFLEARNLCTEVIPPDTTEMPEGTWHKATDEPK